MMSDEVSQSYSPNTGQVASQVAHTTPVEFDQAIAAAKSAAVTLRGSTPQERRKWLEAIADALEANSAELVGVADLETALGVDRLKGELAKTVSQTRFYGDIAVEGSFLGAAIDHGNALARLSHPIGPVAVFGASNFPFVLGVVGHDMSSAIASGCPVVAKAHDAHVGLSLLLRDIVRGALAAAGAPNGTYDLVVGFENGVALVESPAIAAVAFTGSEAAGRRLWQVANERSHPIPVYAEMGTVNPIVVTPAATSRLSEIAAGFVDCYTTSAGQYCTKPGILFAPTGSGMLDAVAGAFDRQASKHQPMLTAPIADGLRLGIEELEQAGATILRRRPTAASGYAGQAVLLTATPDLVRSGSRVLEECFGPVAIVVEYHSSDELRESLTAMQPALVAAVWTAGVGHDPMLSEVVDILEGKVGRIVVNGWTTGAPHSWAQHHGGPWPATSMGAATSIGAAALDRFVRPVAYQNFPAEALPTGVRDDNPWGIAQRVDGKVRQAVQLTP